MHFKAAPWDFEKTCSGIIDPHHPGLYLFHSYDPYLDVYFTRQMKLNFGAHSQLGKVKIVTFEDINFDWLQDHYESPGLFSENESFMVLMSENIDKFVLQRILEISKLIDNSYLILNFSKDSSYLNDADKVNAGKVLSVTAPKFWDTEKLFDFVCKILKLNFDLTDRKFLMEELSQDTGQLISKLSMIKKIYSGDQKLDHTEIKKIINHQELDLFKLASMYSKKDLKRFFNEIITKNIDFEQLSDLSSFMVRHLIKLIDTDHIIAKAKGGRINNYNKEIISCSKLWDNEDLMKAIRKFSIWHMQARSSNPELHSSLRNEYLNCMN